MSRQVINLKVEGVDRSDYPDFCDAYFSYGEWEDTDIPLTEQELEDFQADNLDKLGELAIDQCIYTMRETEYEI